MWFANDFQSMVLCSSAPTSLPDSILSSQIQSTCSRCATQSSCSCTQSYVVHLTNESRLVDGCVDWCMLDVPTVQLTQHTADALKHMLQALTLVAAPGGMWSCCASLPPASKLPAPAAVAAHSNMLRLQALDQMWSSRMTFLLPRTFRV